MPKLSNDKMAARKAAILEAARTCFARKGFRATTIADIMAEAGVSAGGIYTHFANKHEMVAAIGSELGERVQAGEPLDLLASFDGLQSEDGYADACLDLNLWAEAGRDETLAEQVRAAIAEHRRALRQSLPPSRKSAGWVALFEALTLGLEVQRALCGPQRPALRRALKTLLEQA